MVEIFDFLFSDDLFEEKFVCDLNACKGGCCVDGDVGAPITDEEAEKIQTYFPKIKHLLTPRGLEEIERVGLYEVDDEFDKVTPTIDGGLCAFGYYDDNNIVKCAFETIYYEGKSDFIKPISCHLFPIRIVKTAAYEVANYEPRDTLCSAACKLGAKENIPVFRFLKAPITRHYGEETFEAMENVYQDYFLNKKK